MQRRAPALFVYTFLWMGGRGRLGQAVGAGCVHGYLGSRYPGTLVWVRYWGVLRSTSVMGNLEPSTLGNAVVPLWMFFFAGLEREVMT